jgi:hypothetical protein
MRIQISEAAQQDLIEGHRFYECRLTGLGDYSLDSGLADIESLQLHAGIRAHHLAYQRRLTKRFPFAVYYRVESDLVRVHAILDCRRSPAWVRDRLM